MAARNPNGLRTAFVFRGFSSKKKSAWAMPSSELHTPWVSNPAVDAKNELRLSIDGCAFRDRL